MTANAADITANAVRQRHHATHWYPLAFSNETTCNVAVLCSHRTAHTSIATLPGPQAPHRCIVVNRVTERIWIAMAMGSGVSRIAVGSLSTALALQRLGITV